MIDRVCPNCKTKLGEYDHFFCTTCGAALPADKVNSEGVFSHVADFASEQSDPSDKKFDFSAIKTVVKPKALLSALVGALALVGVFFFLQQRVGTPATIVDTQESSPSYTRNVLDVPLRWEINTFGVDHLLEYVPFDAEIVVEGNDLAEFGRTYTAFDPAYSDLFTFLHGKVEQHFVFFAQRVNDEYTWSLIYFPTQSGANISGDLIDKYTWLKFWKNDPIVLITARDEILTKVADAKGNTARNFIHTPIYAASRSGLPKNGKLLVFLTNTTAKEYMNTLVGLPNISDDMKLVIESIGKSNSDYVVIL